ncbi:MAG: MipA/OmpV family protein [Alkalilacustris sp.]
MIRPNPPRRPLRSLRRGGLLTAVGAVLIAALALPAAADTRPGATFTLGAGARLTPAYFGASRDVVGPTGSFQLHHLRIGGFEIGDPMAEPLRRGFRLGGAARWVRARGAGDNPELAGLDRISNALELGLRARYVADSWLVFADLRTGVVGHSGWAGEIGADALWQVTPNLLLSAGPRVGFGDARFQRTYFGVTAAEAARPETGGRFTEFRPGAGLLSVGAELGMRLRLDDAWTVIGTVEYDRLRRDAARSPITAQGSRDQWGARLLLTRRFDLRL